MLERRKNGPIFPVPRSTHQRIVCVPAFFGSSWQQRQQFRQQTHPFHGTEALAASEVQILEVIVHAHLNAVQIERSARNAGGQDGACEVVLACEAAFSVFRLVRR
jgi:hypothetical protein